MSLDINVIKAFFEKYLTMRSTEWGIKSPQEITQKTLEESPKLRRVAQCLKDLQETSNLEQYRNRTADNTSYFYMANWLKLHFNLHKTFKDDYGNSGIMGYLYFPLLSDYLRYGMSYIIRTIYDNDRVVKSLDYLVDFAIIHVGASKPEMDHFNALKERFYAYNRNPNSACDAGFEMALHLDYFATCKESTEQTFENFVAASTAKNDEDFPFCQALSALSLAPRQKQHDEQKESASPLHSKKYNDTYQPDLNVLESVVVTSSNVSTKPPAHTDDSAKDRDPKQFDLNTSESAVVASSSSSSNVSPKSSPRSTTASLCTVLNSSAPPSSPSLSPSLSTPAPKNSHTQEQKFVTVQPKRSKHHHAWKKPVKITPQQLEENNMFAALTLAI